MTHTPYGRVSLASFAHVRLVRHALPISLLILRKKPTVLQSNHEKAFQSFLNRLKSGFMGPDRGYIHDPESPCLQI